MPYSDFTLAKLKKSFGLEQSKVKIFDNITEIQPSEHLAFDIKEGLRLPKNTEKARSENIVSPVLKEVYRKNESKLTLFSGYALNVDATKGLSGNCDCIIAGRANIVELTNPIICLVEAKNGVVEDGYGQCGAEMYASKLYNEDLGTPTNEVYGIITNGSEWQFMLLKNNILLFEEQPILLERLPKILGIFQFIIDRF